MLSLNCWSMVFQAGQLLGEVGKTGRRNAAVPTKLRFFEYRQVQRSLGDERSMVKLPVTPVTP